MGTSCTTTTAPMPLQTTAPVTTGSNGGVNGGGQSPIQAPVSGGGDLITPPASDVTVSDPSLVGGADGTVAGGGDTGTLALNDALAALSAALQQLTAAVEALKVGGAGPVPSDIIGGGDVAPAGCGMPGCTMPDCGSMTTGGGQAPLAQVATGSSTLGIPPTYQIDAGPTATPPPSM